MSFDYDVDDVDADLNLEYSDDFSGDELDEELEFEDIDFDALGIDPTQPTRSKPGSEEKVLMLAARYAAGVPLWNNSDCYDHGPGDMSLRRKA